MQTESREGKHLGGGKRTNRSLRQKAGNNKVRDHQSADCKSGDDKSADDESADLDDKGGDISSRHVFAAWSTAPASLSPQLLRRC